MPVLRNLLFMAARRVMTDPRVRAKAADMYDAEVRPRAHNAAKATKANLDFARDELREIAAEIDPRDDPKAFLRAAKKRLFGSD